MKNSSSFLFLTGFALVYFGLWHITYVTTPEYAAATSYVDSSEEISRLAGEGAARYGLPTGWIFRRAGMASFRLGVRGSRGTLKVRVDVIRVGDQWRVVDASFTGESGSGQLRSENRAALHASSALVDAAYALLQRGHPNDALAELDRAVELDSLHVDARLWRAIVYRSMNRPDAAAAELRSALELNPGHRRAQHELAALDEASGSAPARCTAAQAEGCSPKVQP